MDSGIINLNKYFFLISMMSEDILDNIIKNDTKTEFKDILGLVDNTNDELNYIKKEREKIIEEQKCFEILLKNINEGIIKYNKVKDELIELLNKVEQINKLDTSINNNFEKKEIEETSQSNLLEGTVITSKVYDMLSSPSKPLSIRKDNKGRFVYTVDGTTFVFNRSAIVIGKVVNDKQIPLTKFDILLCDKNKFECYNTEKTCKGIVKSTGKKCEHPSKIDGFCGIHAPIKVNCKGVVKSTGKKCESLAKIDGFCGIHNPKKEEKYFK
jgi:hypothetical protein